MGVKKVKYKGKDVNGMENRNTEPLASEIYKDLKDTIRFKEKVIMWMAGIIAILVIGLIGTNLYHIWQWSQFDTIAIDSGEGGYANYVGGDNPGGIFNGENSGTPSESGKK